MNNSIEAYKNITSHIFVELGFGNAVDVSKKLYTGSISKVEPEYLRDPDEYEFYVMEVGHTLAHLLNLCEQLIHSALFLTSFSQTKRMKNAGITRASQLQYNVENYIIRSQSLHDRVLKLVNAVFHLGLRPQDCRHRTITKNTHVRITDIPSNLKKIRKLVDQYRQDRNIVIHHESYQEDDLRKLEMFYLVQSLENDQKPTDYEIPPYVTRNLSKKIVDQKTEEYDHFNVTAFTELELLFNKLKPKYNDMLIDLNRKCGHANNH